VIGLGAGGHAKVVVETLRLTGGYEFAGLLDPKKELWGSGIMGVSVLGGDSLLPELYGRGVRHAFIGLGGTGDNRPRQRLYEHALSQGFQLVQVVHPQAVVSPSALLGDGITIMAGAIINAEAHIGFNVIVNTGAIVEHDCMIGNHVHVATGVKLASTVRVAEGAHIGVGASVRQGICIGEWAVIGAGAVVVKDVEPWTVVAGVPARELTPNTHDSLEAASGTVEGHS